MQSHDLKAHNFQVTVEIGVVPDYIFRYALLNGCSMLQ